MRRTQEALIWFREHGGVGIVNRYGQMIATADNECARQFHPSTWLRLVAEGELEGGPGFTIQMVEK